MDVFVCSCVLCVECVGSQNIAPVDQLIWWIFLNIFFSKFRYRLKKSINLTPGRGVHGSPPLAPGLCWVCECMYMVWVHVVSVCVCACACMCVCMWVYVCVYWNRSLRTHLAVLCWVRWSREGWVRAFLRFHPPHHLWEHKPKDVSDSPREAVDVSKLSTTPIKQINDNPSRGNRLRGVHSKNSCGYVEGKKACVNCSIFSSMHQHARHCDWLTKPSWCQVLRVCPDHMWEQPNLPAEDVWW